MPKSLVLVSPSGQALGSIESLRDELVAAGGPGTEVSVVGWDVSSAPSGIPALSLRAGGPAGSPGSRLLRRTIGRSFIGLNLIRLSPWDAGRVFWRGVRKNPAVLNALVNADALVALERDALFTVWHAARRSKRTPVAVTGMAAALDRLRRADR